MGGRGEGRQGLLGPEGPPEEAREEEPGLGLLQGVRLEGGEEGEEGPRLGAGAELAVAGKRSILPPRPRGRFFRPAQGGEGVLGLRGQGGPPAGRGEPLRLLVEGEGPVGVALPPQGLGLDAEEVGGLPGLARLGQVVGGLLQAPLGGEKPGGEPVPLGSLLLGDEAPRGLGEGGRDAPVDQKFLRHEPFPGEGPGDGLHHLGGHLPQDPHGEEGGALGDGEGV